MQGYVVSKICFSLLLLLVPLYAPAMNSNNPKLIDRTVFIPVHCILIVKGYARRTKISASSGTSLSTILKFFLRGCNYTKIEGVHINATQIPHN